MTRGSILLLSVLAVAAATACSSKSEVKGGTGSGPDQPIIAPVAVPKPTLTVFALAEVRGQIGPCGCTSDPLGDISRTTQLIEAARAQGPVLVVDAGSLLYSKDPIPSHLAAQEELKADLLANVYAQHMKVDALGLGPADLVAGLARVRFDRTVSNLALPSGDHPPAEPRVIKVGDVLVGVFGVVDRSVSLKGAVLTDPIEAGKAAVARLEQQGVQLVIGLVQAASKRDAVALAREIGGIDITVAGLGALAPEPDVISVEADKVGDGWLVIPANRGQIVSRLDVTVRPGGGPLVDAVGKAAAAAKMVQLDRQLVSLDAALKKFAEDKAADPVFVKQKQAEREHVLTEKKQLETQPAVVPATGSYFMFEQIRINKTLACSAPVRDAIKAYDAAVGKANVAAAKGKRPVPPAKGKPGYVGNEACSDCHSEAVEFWKTTRHAGAWKTLVDRGQEFDYECTSCHVTGWEKPGGSNMGKTDGLVDVGCETCHGPGSIHADKGGEEKPLAILHNPPQDQCATQCHTKEHSDTFEYTSYLRDILGKGHGEDARKKLGDGPTGHELRKVALDKAGRQLGAGCVK